MENKKNILDVVSISGLRVKKFEGERGYLSTGDLDFNKISNIELVSYENKPSRANQNVNVGEVIFAKMKDTKKTLVIDEENKDIIVSTGFYVLKPSEQILSKYLYHYLNSDYFLNQKNKLSKGATQCALNNEGLSNITIYMYNLETQKKIVEVLDKAQELIEKRKKQIEELDLLVKSKFIEMFGDPITNPKNWERATLDEVCTFIKDGPHTSPKYVENGIPFVSVNNIINDFWDFSSVKYISREDYEVFSKRCKPEKGDILYTKGGTTGFAKYIDIDIEFCNWVHLAVLKYKKDIINGIFLTKMLNTNYCYAQSQRYTRGIANRDLVLSQMKLIKVFLPPLEAQEKYAEFIKQVDKLKFEMEHSLKELEDNFNSLMQKAFKGELFN
ncbi:restriction endonuclease subunit S [Clostridium perfringens]|uniref:restriction endonuclease subunit S n=1 Tax=Clostridium perfringens TaxID=1502 RepID=UPI0006672698|nr:restriction endonuclease subunit S [Clostridium perfringens]MBI6053386.1 restriction endonuclease subunit S [Clostridium perfringens]MDK0727646.1 restriction endonuclease subunit S [Clostridium perfringens]MDM0689829.1 restriction endonuclease subunit S [Clostridium perfringens]